ncbi:hypothetical protein [Microbacterium sp. MTN4-26]|uniref:hypothetical protein n=1 Tax=unclassified Microbacterium TaxID=2609290 RepID=UPI0036F23A85
MPEIASNPVLNKATFTVGSNSYTSHILSYEWVPNAPTQEVTDIGGTVHRFAGQAGWTLNLGLFQDWTDTGLATMFFEDEGEEATVTVETAQASFAATITVVAPSIGGAAAQISQSSISLPSSKPVRTAVSS